LGRSAVFIRGKKGGWLLALAFSFKFGFNSCIRGKKKGQEEG